MQQKNNKNRLWYDVWGGYKQYVNRDGKEAVDLILRCYPNSSL